MRIHKKILPLLGLQLLFSSMFAIDESALPAHVENFLLEGKLYKNSPIVEDAIPGISPWVIPPGTPLNKFDLFLVLGQDENLTNSPVTPFTTQPFKDALGWNDAQVTALRQAAVAWFIERFGIDFSNGYYDPSIESIITDFGIMVPVLYKGDYRVLLSNNTKILPYSALTPSSVVRCEYTVVFTQPPTYGGTYAGGVPIQGKITDVISYAALKFFLDYSGKKTKLFFGRAYYPTDPILTTPTRQVDRYQLFSPEFGPGFASASSSIEYPANAQGTYNTNAYSTWSFPGSHLSILSDYNGFTQAPPGTITP